jgi:hypothetical protein
VLDAATEGPLAGARVSILPASTRPDESKPASENTKLSNAAGAFAMDVEPGVHDLVAAVPGYGGARLCGVRVGDGPVEVTLHARPGVSLAGSVRDARRQPVPRVEVDIERRCERCGARHSWIAGAWTRTGHDGELSFEGVEPGAYTLVVRTAAEDPTTVDFDVGPGDAAPRVDVTLSK